MVRQNLSTNPAVGVNTSGFTGVTWTRTAVSGFDRPFAARAAMDFGAFPRFPADAAAQPGQDFVASLYIRSSLTLDVRLYLYYVDSGGSNITYSTTTFNLAGGAVTRIHQAGTTPANTASVDVRMYRDSWGTGTSTIDVTQLLLEQTATLQPYADGDTSGWQWDGTAGLSTSSERTAVEVATIPAEVAAEGLPVTAILAPGVVPANVVAESLPTALLHPRPSDTVAEAVPVTVAHHAHTKPTDAAAEALDATASGTKPNPADVVVEALSVTVGIAAQLPARRPPLVPLALPPTRVLAQSILSGQWLSWDLPVTDLEITWQLSGPTTISGSFTPEISGLTDLGLEAWGTWIHIEGSGLIRASGILQPTALDGETLSLEAVGPSGYAARVPYRGVFSGIQVDPADMVRLLWDHIQSHPRGDLGVTVVGTTPVRIGTPEIDVEFDTAAGEHVDFTAGPYKLEWWQNTMCGREIDELATETPFDYVERCGWNADKTAVEHWIELAHPRIGRRLDGLHFEQGVNVLEVAPLEEPADAYASQVYVQGKGEGATTVMAYAGRDVGGRLRLPVVVEDKTIATKTRARAVASDQLAARQAALVEVGEIAVDVRDPSAPLGSFAPGDEIAPVLDLAYAGRLSAWHRITAIRYRPDAEAAVLSLTRRSEFADR